MCYKVESCCRYYRWSHCVTYPKFQRPLVFKCHKWTSAVFDVPHDVKHDIYFFLNR